MYCTTKSPCQSLSNTEAAIKRVFDLHYAPLCHFAAKITADRPAAEDLVAETFVKLWKLYDQFDGEQAMRAFLFVAVRNACFNFLKKNRRQLAHMEEWQVIAMQEERVNNELQRMEVLQMIYAEIEQLPRQRKKICKMILVKGLNVAAVARRLCLSEQTVRNQKTRGICQLRSRIFRAYAGLASFEW